MTYQAGRVVLITGCSTGIGRATALYLAKRGWRVFASARRLEDIRALHSECIAVLPLDVCDEESRIEAINTVVRQAGRLDALVNNAGLNIGGPLELVSLEDARAQFETNVWGALRLAQLAIPVMRQQGGGRIVNISSIMVRTPLPFSGLYCASKSAIESMTEILRWELSPWNIQVSVVEPGSYKTNIDNKAKAFRMRFAEHPLYARYFGWGRKKQPIGASGPLSPIRQMAKRILIDKNPEGAAQVIERALDDKHPRVRYEAGLDTHVYLLMRRLAPERLFDYYIRRVYGFRRIPPKEI